MQINRFCPKCGSRLIVQLQPVTTIGRLDHEARIECITKGCYYAEPLPEAIRMRFAGYAELPGLEATVAAIH